MKKLLFTILATFSLASQAQNWFDPGCHFTDANDLSCGNAKFILTPQQRIPSPPESPFLYNSAFYTSNRWSDASGLNYTLDEIYDPNQHIGNIQTQYNLGSAFYRGIGWQDASGVDYWTAK